MLGLQSQSLPGLLVNLVSGAMVLDRYTESLAEKHDLMLNQEVLKFWCFEACQMTQRRHNRLQVFQIFVSGKIKMYGEKDWGSLGIGATYR